MGQSESNPIKNIDKRTARREYSGDFSSSIQKFRVENKNLKIPTNDTINHALRVCVRKRPIFKNDINNFEFDVITCVTNGIIIHDCRMHPDMRRRYIQHNFFALDEIFDSQVSSKSVYNRTVLPLLKSSVENGHCSCIMYGQTGSGKTYTMSSIYNYVAHDIFTKKSDHHTISISILEISGDQCFDILNRYNPVDLISDLNEYFHPSPMTEPTIISPEELMGYIQYASAMRSTASTGVHESSSRSHLVIKLYIQNLNNNTEGSLTLVDLAGSEHNIDSMYHSAERRKESAKINSSLLAFKECVALKASSKHRSCPGSMSHVFRKSKLTMALKESLIRPDAKTVVIGTVAPSSKDTEHSLNTVRYCCIMNGQTSCKRESRFLTGGFQTMEMISDVDVSGVMRRNHAHSKAGRSVPGLKTSNGNYVYVDRENDCEMEAEDVAEMRKVREEWAFALLPSHMKGRLKKSRNRVDGNIWQKRRLCTKHKHSVESTKRRGRVVREGDGNAGIDDESGTPVNGVDPLNAARNDNNALEKQIREQLAALNRVKYHLVDVNEYVNVPPPSGDTAPVSSSVIPETTLLLPAPPICDAAADMSFKMVRPNFKATNYTDLVSKKRVNIESAILRENTRTSALAVQEVLDTRKRIADLALNNRLLELQLMEKSSNKINREILEQEEARVPFFDGSYLNCDLGREMAILKRKSLAEVSSSSLPSALSNTEAINLPVKETSLDMRLETMSAKYECGKGSESVVVKRTSNQKLEVIRVRRRRRAAREVLRRFLRFILRRRNCWLQK